MNESDDGHKLQIIKEFTEHCVASNKSLLLVIDDAHLLTDGALDVLIKLKLQAEGNIMNPRLVLFADDSIADILRKPELRNMNTGNFYHIDLQAFNEKEILDYLQKKLQSSDLANRVSITEEQVKQIWTLSQGLPGRIKQVAREVLTTKKAIAHYHRYLPIFHIASIVMVVMLLGIVIANKQLATKLGINKTNVVQIVQSTDSQQTNTDNIGRNIVDSASHIFATLKHQVMNFIDEVYFNGSNNDVGIIIESPAIKKNTPESAKPTNVIQVIQAINESAVAVNTDVNSSTSEKIIVDKQVHPIEKYDERIIFSWDKQAYVYQLLVASQLDRAVNFIRRQSNPEDFYMFAIDYKLQPRYVVVTSPQTSKEAAQKMLSNAPKSVRQLKPWLRKVIDIHQYINDNRNTNR